MFNLRNLVISVYVCVCFRVCYCEKPALKTKEMMTRRQISYLNNTSECVCMCLGVREHNMTVCVRVWTLSVRACTCTKPT